VDLDETLMSWILSTGAKMPDVHVAVWRRSSRCEGGACVEILSDESKVTMRNSTEPQLTMFVPVEAWRGFVAGVRAGEFDRPST
jgi:Domain of unknown function (DUF397)